MRPEILDLGRIGSMPDLYAPLMVDLWMRMNSDSAACVERTEQQRVRVCCSGSGLWV